MLLFQYITTDGILYKLWILAVPRATGPKELQDAVYLSIMAVIMDSA